MYFLGLVLRPIKDIGNFCTSTTTSEGQMWESIKKKHQDVSPDASLDGIACPCIKICVSYHKKLHKDYGDIALPK